MPRTQRASLLLAGLAVFGCGPAADREITGPPSLQQSSAQQSVTGHADVFLFGCDERYSFSAIRHQDGSVSGEWQVHDVCAAGPGVPEGTFITHGTVTCFTILADGKTARVGGITERSTWPGVEPPQEAVWTVRDNGEGKNDPPDMATGLFFGFNPGAAEFHCSAGIEFEPFESERGNIQVRP